MNSRFLAAPAFALIAGFAGGWLARGDGDADRRADAPVAERPAGTAEAAPGLVAAPPVASKAPPIAPAPPPLGAERLRTASVSDLWDLRNAKTKPTIDEGGVDVLLARLRDSVRDGNTGLFLVVVDLLGLADSAKGDAALVEIMADVTTPLPEVTGPRFAEALLGSAAPGITAAARARCDRAIAEGNDSWTSVAGWFDLVARSGGPADFAWIESVATSTQRRNSAAEALARAGRPEALDTFRRIFATAALRGDVLAELARTQPDAAAVIVRDILSGRLLLLMIDGNEAIVSYARGAPKDRLGEVETWILGLPKETDRIGAVYAIGVLSSRGYDVSALAGTVEAPVRCLERVAAGEPVTDANRSLVVTSVNAIDYSRITWTERAARALEGAAAAVEKDGVKLGGSDLTKLAAKIRAGLAARWK